MNYTKKELETFRRLVVEELNELYNKRFIWGNVSSEDIAFIENLYDKIEKNISEVGTSRSCKDCKHGINGMLNFKSERCEACYYDGRIGGNCLFEEKQTEEKTDKSCESCRFADLQPHEFPCCACSQAYMSRWELQKGAEE